MAFFTDFSEKFRLPGGMRSALRRSYATLTAFFDRSDLRQKVEKCVLGLVKYLMSVDGEVSERKILQLRNLLMDFYPEDAIELHHRLRELPLVEPDAAAELFAPLPAEAKRRILDFLLQAILADNVAAAKLEVVKSLAAKIGVPDAEFAELEANARAELRKRGRLLRSGAGILVALGVIVVFVLLATWLRSVIFGLIGAYLLLPVEKFCERRLRAKKGIGYWIFRFGDLLLYPLHRLSALVTRRAPQADPVANESKQEKKIIAQAVAMTAIGFLIIVTLIGGFLFSKAGMYANKLQHQVVVAQTQPAVVEPAPAPELKWYQWGYWKNRFSNSGPVAEAAPEVAPAEPTFLTSVVKFLDRLSEQFQNLPLVQRGIVQLRKLVNDEAFINRMWAELLRKSGGLFSFSFRVVGTIANWVVDLLLSIFFGLLFLIKLAEFCREDESRGKQSEYLVRTVFNGDWLPGADERTIAEANRIIGGTIARLRIWARGYITIVLIDMAVYTLAFFCLRVPYFPILGMIAGCGVLLPYIGPISTSVLTVLVTMMSGGDGAQILGIIVFYLIYSGIIEQFITYPAIIGDSLGLSTLETIIAVLLGALIAGITGMILALPAASVIKFLVPQIYRRIGDIGGAAGRQAEEDILTNKE